MMDFSADPHKLLPQADRTALALIDLQERLIAAMPSEDAQRVVRNAGILIETAKTFHMPVFLSEQYPRGLGTTAAEIRQSLPENLVAHEKLTFSCCAAPQWMHALEQTGRRAVILCGIEAHVCVLQTAIDLLANGYSVYIAADAVCSRSAINRDLSLNLLRQAGAVISSTEILAFGLVGAAGTDTFKHISRLVK